MKSDSDKDWSDKIEFRIPRSETIFSQQQPATDCRENETKKFGLENLCNHAITQSIGIISNARHSTDRAAFYQGLKSKVGLAAAKAAALRINLSVQGCSIVAAPMHAPSRTSLLLPLLLSHNLPLPRSLVRDGQTTPHRPRLVVSRSACPPISPPPHATSFVLGPAVINTHASGIERAGFNTQQTPPGKKGEGPGCASKGGTREEQGRSKGGAREEQGRSQAAQA